MKKVLFLILCMSMFSVVSAKEIFIKDFETEKQISTVSYYDSGYHPDYPEHSNKTYEFSYLLYTNYQEYLDGYITSEEIYNSEDDSWKTLVTYYDINGKVIKQNYDYDFTIDDLLVVNDVIYVLAYDSEAADNQYTIKILDNDLKESKSSILSNYRKNWDAYTRKYYGIDFIMEDNNIVIYSGTGVYVIDYELSNDTYVTTTTYDMTKLEFVKYTILMQSFGNYKGGKTAYVSANKVSNDETILSGAYFDEDCVAGTTTCTTSYIISSFDNTNTMKWSYEGKELSAISDVSYVGDYIIGIANKYNENNEVINVIAVLDKDGKIVQEIEEDENLLMLRSTSNGFMVVTYEDKDEEDLTKYNIDVYVYGYNIETKTDGNGTVEVVKNAKEGKEITYKVIPKENYKIDKITITDSEGNKIETTNNIFTMPNKDVTIEVGFIVDNPDTYVNESLYLVFIISMLVSIVGINFYSRMKWMNT